VLLSQILFLNKIDLFVEKLPRSPLEDYLSVQKVVTSGIVHRFVSLDQSAVLFFFGSAPKLTSVHCSS
jgi:hypothetical protein